MTFFEEDLNKRVNPEKSRNFSEAFYEEHLLILKKIYKKIQILFPIKPLKISIVGTNGKGSTGSFLSQLFYLDGDTVGLYTSPHLVSITERIQIQQKSLDIQTLNFYYQKFFETILQPEFLDEYQKLTYFEALTIFCVYLFYEKNLQVQIYEAGLGGRLDATKIVEPEVVILTTIKLDHTKILGSTHEKILKEKLGIISLNTKKLFIGDQQLRPYIEKIPINVEKIYYFCLRPHWIYLENFKGFACFVFENLKEKKVSLKVYRELKSPQGRLEIHKIQNQYFIYDVAHNVSAIYFFLVSLKKKFAELGPENSLFLVGFLKDRSYKNLNRLYRWTKIQSFVSNPVIVGKPEFLEQNTSQNQVLYFHDLKEFIENIKEKKFIIFCGSFRLYVLFGEIINYQKKALTET
ncbi:MAG: Mur ligase family protein [Leptospiraceae bacterium]|nr:Mur ligase family protein [Leptospiraceae bacterium]MDW7975911.1 hypothetical protein [Leptospiraceae bacterium]